MGPIIRLRASVLALAAVAVFATLPMGARAEDQSLAAEGGLGVGAAVASIVYAPLKLAYTVGGITLGALTFLWSGGNGDMAGPLFTMTMDGDYVITPEHLTGDNDVTFAGG